MPKGGKTVVGVAGMVLGITLVGGSVIGGITLAMDLRRANDQGSTGTDVSTVPVSTDTSRGATPRD